MLLTHPLLRTRLPLLLEGARTDALHLVQGKGRHVQAHVPNGWLTLCLPLAGELTLESQDSRWCLPQNHLSVWREGRLQVVSHTPCWWLMLTGAQDEWDRHLHQLRQYLRPTLFPWQVACPGDVRRLLIHLARADRLRPGTPEYAESVLVSVCAALLDHQRDLHALLARCSGRTLQRRQQTLLRLLRVQHLIRHNAEGRVDLAALAASASYSPCHLLRIYRQVFGETPTEYATRLRYERAWQLVRNSAMPVCEITEMLGFESQSAFCRAFKHTFGATVSEIRRLVVAGVDEPALLQAAA